MNISLDFDGTYNQHKEFFDTMAVSMQAAGHKIGIITGEREGKKQFIINQLGFQPDFVCLWPDAEFIVNGNRWKVERMLENGVALHFDDDATELKKWTDLWVVKTLNPGQIGKF